MLEQGGILNNFGDTVTCIIPTDPGWPNPQISDRKTAAGTFRFFAMPAHLVDERAGTLADIRDMRFDYPCATLEKAWLDWIYLGASIRSRMTRPPLDLDLKALNAARLRRLAKTMRITERLENWQTQWQRFQDDPDVQANQSALLGV